MKEICRNKWRICSVGSRCRLVAFAVVCCMLLFGGCVGESTVQETETETTTTETTTEATTEGEYPEYNQSMEDWEVPVNANEFLQPSEEELNEIMMQEAQEAMQEYEQDEGYYDYDPSLGKRGR